MIRTIRKRPLVLSLAVIALTALGCPGPTGNTDPVTIEILVQSADPTIAGALVRVSGGSLTSVDGGTRLIQVDSVSGAITYIVRGPFATGERAFAVGASDREDPPEVEVLQAARGAAADFANVNPSGVVFYTSVRQR